MVRHFFIISGVIILLTSGTEAGIFSSIFKKRIAVKEWHVENCGGKPNDIQVHNLNVYTNEDGEIQSSGIVEAKTFLSSPITAKVTMERRVIALWVKLPCVQEFGSCTYDMCSFSIDDGAVCPAPFLKSRTPCRCPLEKGMYIVPEDLKIPISSSYWSNLARGKYRATVRLSHGDNELACYNVSFKLKTV